MRVAVTGATGFIGGHVIARLAQEQTEIVCIGRNRKAWNGIGSFAEMDIACPPPDAYAALGCPDLLIHLAWDGLPRYQSMHHLETELPRQYAFLRALVEGGLHSLLVAGTCFEYGMACGCLSESVSPHPVTPYALAKDVLRQQLEFLLREKTTRLTWARLFYLWGEGQSQSSLFSSFQAAVARGEPAFPMSGGEQLRDYLPATTMADYLVRLALKKEGMGTVNVCSGRPISVRHLVEDWISDLGADIRLDLGRYPYPEHEPMAFWGDNKKLMKVLGNGPHG